MGYVTKAYVRAYTKALLAAGYVHGFATVAAIKEQAAVPSVVESYAWEFAERMLTRAELEVEEDWSKKHSGDFVAECDVCRKPITRAAQAYKQMIGLTFGCPACQNDAVKNPKAP